MKLSNERNAWCRAVFASGLCLLAACADHETRLDETETHFLRSCDSSCGDGLSCICGVCTEPCASSAACDALAGAATCAALPASCADDVAMACDVTCEASEDCAPLGEAFTCRAGRCRGGDEGTSGQGGGGGSGGEAGASGQGGGGGSVVSGSGGAAGPDGGPSDAAIDGGPADAAVDGSANESDCNAIGEACCDPFPGDGPNYCNGVRLQCGADNTCEVNCDCALGAFAPACGIDGQTHDATCGDECVPVEIACRGQCPCEDEGYCAAECTGAAPDQAVVDACAALPDMPACTSFATGGFPSSCRWVTPETSACLFP